MNQSTKKLPLPEDLVAAALNEQGYLFHCKVLEILQSPSPKDGARHDWRLEASEVPVSLPNEDETRIDLVLRHGANKADPWRAVVECKRSARDYKRWVFFGETSCSQGPSSTKYYFERADLSGTWDHRGEPPLMHRVEPRDASPDCPVFDYGVEVRTNREGSDKRSSATTAIEDAFQQVTLGQAGLARWLRAKCVLNFRLVPIVITTAEVVSAQFPLSCVSPDQGKIEPSDVRLHPRQWLATNFRVSDIISQYSRIETHRQTSLEIDLAARQVRTVFVVQAASLHEFLAWLGRTVAAT
jgi:hypothetical protein